MKKVIIYSAIFIAISIANLACYLTINKVPENALAITICISLFVYSGFVFRSCRREMRVIAMTP